MSESQKRPMFLRFLSGLWDGINGLRRIVLNILFLFILIAFFAALIPKGQEPLSKDSALIVAPSGYLVDQLSAKDPFAQLMGGNDGQTETRLRDLQTAISRAKDDDKIKAMVLDLGGMGARHQQIGRAGPKH